LPIGRPGGMGFLIPTLAAISRPSVLCRFRNLSRFKPADYLLHEFCWDHYKLFFPSWDCSPRLRALVQLLLGRHHKNDLLPLLSFNLPETSFRIRALPPTALLPCLPGNNQTFFDPPYSVFESSGGYPITYLYAGPPQGTDSLPFPRTPTCSHVKPESLTSFR